VVLRNKVIPGFNNSVIEPIKHIKEYGAECWSARELMASLEYSGWRSFVGVIDKAKYACQNSHQEVADHFVEIKSILYMATYSKCGWA